MDYIGFLWQHANAIIFQFIGPQYVYWKFVFLFYLESGINQITSLQFDSVVAKRTLVQCTSIIVNSSIDPFTLARELYSKEFIKEDTYKKVIDRETRDSSEDRLERILGHLRDRVTRDASILISFLNILEDLTHQDLAVLIVKKYKGMLYRMIYYMY